MPKCACFHSYELTPVSDREYRLKLPSEGLGNLTEIIKRSGLVAEITPEPFGFDFVDNFIFYGVNKPETLAKFMNLLKGKIIVDLSPQLDECYALGPYTVFDREKSALALWGEHVNRAKYQKDQSASIKILKDIEDFIDRHPLIRTINDVVSPPKSDNITPNLADAWSHEIASKRGWRRLIANKTQITRPQKKRLDTETEEDLIGRVANTTRVDGVNPGSHVLILDDTIRSGGTLIEIARALREAGAREVYGLSAAKDAKFTNGGVELNKESWE